MVGNTRIHLDQVVGLGHFIELEAVLERGQTDEQGQETVSGLMRQLGIEKDDLIDVAYIDLLKKKRASARQTLAL
jgi:predicted adenylyl cyclase CyaB